MWILDVYLKARIEGATQEEARQRVMDDGSVRIEAQLLPDEAARDIARHVFRLADGCTLEANAAMKSIVRRDTGEDWKEYVTRLMREEGVIEAEEREIVAHLGEAPAAMNAALGHDEDIAAIAPVIAPARSEATNAA